MSYYEQARKDAREAMGSLIKQTVDDNLDDMVKAKVPQVSASAIQ